MKVKLDDVIEALEFVNGEVDATVYFNPQKNDFVYLGEFMDTPSEVDEDYDDYISFPSKYDINEYNMMEEFIDTIDDENVYNELYIAINNKGAFRKFKDTCQKFNILNNWSKFRDEKYKEIAIEWCKENNIEYF